MTGFPTLTSRENEAENGSPNTETNKNVKTNVHIGSLITTKKSKIWLL